MALIDVIEKNIAEMKAGQITREVAVQRIVHDSNGGLTAAGAEELIDNPKPPRARYNEVFGQAQQLFDRLNRNP